MPQPDAADYEAQVFPVHFTRRTWSINCTRQCSGAGDVQIKSNSGSHKMQLWTRCDFKTVKQLQRCMKTYEACQELFAGYIDKSL